MQVAPRRLLTLREAARLAGVAESTFHNWRQAGRIKGLRHNGRGRVLYVEEDVLALQAGKPKKPGPNGGGNGRKVIPLRGDQLTLDQVLDAGDLDRERAEAALKLLAPYEVVALRRRVVFTAVKATSAELLEFDFPAAAAA